MVKSIRSLRRRIQKQRQVARRRFERHRRLNLLAKAGDFDYVVVLDHLKVGFNIGKIFRSAEAFGAREVYLVGIDYFDPAPAMGGFKYVPARFFDAFADAYRDLTGCGYTLFTLEPGSGENLSHVRLPVKSAFVVGHEELGHSFRRDDFAGIRALRIPQFGRVESLNVSIAASVVMYEYIRQHAQSVGG